MKGKTGTFNGLKFRYGEVVRDGVETKMRSPFPDLKPMGMALPVITTTGWVRRIGRRYVMVITEYDPEGREFDYSIIPAGPGVKINYL